ncbi:hypothetical protein N7474_009624 [Penicillium riverlandense]|uniref:uncharacterized protein n=1 Tax=Penicillium riverlandense TaxID=1903569 RepID=UPI00254762EB|nr:uncharacterized protein N7474_009624 [Penicillium riverlandense]KAJ5808355.1 hypothetical protein N7474_009624 [Penicillium riverlandense]
MLFNFTARREAIENDGVYVGGYGIRRAFKAVKHDGVYDTSEDRIEAMNAVEQDWEAKEERALVRKLDFRVLLPCCLVYFMAYLDRANLGNVKVLQVGTSSSLVSALHLEGTQFNWAVSISYFAVTALLLPSTIVLKKYSAKRYFPCAMILWGTVVMAMAGIKNGAGLLAARFCLGIPESGIVPCCVMYFSFWYRPRERALRLAFFHVSNSIAGAVSGFLAAGLDHLDGKGGLMSWQWVFIIEGAIPLVMAPVIYFLLLTFPEDSTALSDRERYIAINRFGRGATRSTDITWDTAAFIRIMTRPSTYCFFITYICLTTVAVSQATFLPSIFHYFLKFGASKSNIYTAALNLAIIAPYLVVPWHSDKVRERIWHYLFCMLSSIPCYGVWLYFSYHSDDTSIAPISLYGVALLGMMVVVAQPVILSYRSATLYGAAEQSVGTSAAVASLSIASIIAPQMFPDTDAPLFHSGFIGCVTLQVICVISCLCIPILLLLEAEHRKRKTGHAMPLRAILDAENSQVSEAALARLHAIQEQEAKDLEDMKIGASGGNVQHVEDVENR